MRKLRLRGYITCQGCRVRNKQRETCPGWGPEHRLGDPRLLSGDLPGASPRLSLLP